MRIVALLFAFLSLASFNAQAQGDGPSGKKPNILFLFSDDQRADTIHALGNAAISTPNLDALAARGTAFTRAYCMGSRVPAVCMPSRAMLMSGRTLFRADLALKGQGTWPEQFAAAGYSTFITGKWHNQAASVTRAFQAGKAVFLGGMSGHNPAEMVVQDISAERKLAERRPAGKLPSELFADRAVEFLQGQKDSAKPWLCYVAFNLPHDPRIASPASHAGYDPAKLSIPPNFLPQHPFNNGALEIRDEALLPWPRTAAAVCKELADYYACVSFVDGQVGRILQTLRSIGEEENTIVVFSSDHGLAIGSHGLMGKQNLYDHSMRAPLFIAGPRVPQNRKSDAMCYLLDIFPTLGELAGVGAPEGSEGMSLTPVLAGKSEKHRESIFTAYANVQRAVRDERWKLIVYPQIDRQQLFDLVKDPAETRDLAGDLAHAPEAERLRALLEDWQKKSGDGQSLRVPHAQPEAFDFEKANARRGKSGTE
jgi:arylsulfatase A-like enzyme